MSLPTVGPSFGSVMGAGVAMHGTRSSADYGGTRSNQNETVAGVSHDFEDLLSRPHRFARSWSHCHEHDKPNEGVDKIARRKLISASILCLLFMIGEIVGGILANSLAIITDAAHMLTDFTGFVISLVSIYLASRPATTRMNFGWHRAEVMGALVSVLLIWVVTGILVYMAIMRVKNQSYNIDATVMLITAAVGVAVNLLLGLTLNTGGDAKKDNHGHSHGLNFGVRPVKSASTPNLASSAASAEPMPSPRSEALLRTDDNVDSQRVPLLADVTLEERQRLLSERHTGSMSTQVSCEMDDKRGININVRAAFIHVLGDLLQSVGVVTAALIIYYKPEWKVADPICTFLFSCIVLFTTITILRDIVNVLMEGVPKDVSFVEVKKCLMKLDGVRGIHNLHIWSLTTNKTAVSVHLALDSRVNHQEVIAHAGKTLRKRFGIFECTVQTEPYAASMLTCSHCIGPAE